MRKRRPQIGRGRDLTELVKGSLEYTRRAISTAFYSQFPDTEAESFFVEEIFDDYLIANSYGGDLRWDEFYQVAYSRAGGETYTFAPREQWQIVELAYVPKRPAEVEEAKESAEAGPAPPPREERLVTCEVNVPARVREALDQVLARLSADAKRRLKARGSVILKVADLREYQFSGTAGHHPHGGYEIEVDERALPKSDLLRAVLAHELVHIFTGHIDEMKQLREQGLPYAQFMNCKEVREREVDRLLVEELGFGHELRALREWHGALLITLAAKSV